jgi:hypothetical protein
MVVSQRMVQPLPRPVNHTSEKRAEKQTNHDLTDSIEIRFDRQIQRLLESYNIENGLTTPIESKEKKK